MPSIAMLLRGEWRRRWTSWLALAFLISLIGVVFGVPIGVLAGKVVWKDFATSLGAVPVALPTGRHGGTGHRDHCRRCDSVVAHSHYPGRANRAWRSAT